MVHVVHKHSLSAHPWSSYTPCGAAASVANGTTDAGHMPAEPFQPGTRYPFLWQCLSTSPVASARGMAGDEAEAVLRV